MEADCGLTCITPRRSECEQWERARSVYPELYVGGRGSQVGTCMRAGNANGKAGRGDGMVPVHPTYRPLLGMVWKEMLYVDSALPFGLRLAPIIFNSLADAIQWILERQRVEVIHYLDDFLIFGTPILRNSNGHWRQ